MPALNINFHLNTGITRPTQPNDQKGGIRETSWIGENDEIDQACYLLEVDSRSTIFRDMPRQESLTLIPNTGRKQGHV